LAVREPAGAALAEDTFCIMIAERLARGGEEGGCEGTASRRGRSVTGGGAVWKGREGEKNLSSLGCTQTSFARGQHVAGWCRPIEMFVIDVWNGLAGAISSVLRAGGKAGRKGASTKGRVSLSRSLSLSSHLLVPSGDA
jgi:hypothetical protein